MKFYLEFEQPIAEIENKITEIKQKQNQELVKNEIDSLEQKLIEMKRKIFSNLTPFQKVQIARHLHRPTALDYIKIIFSDFFQLEGDRAFRADPAVVCGIANLEGIELVIISQQKGKNLEENQKRNYGMMHPEGYRAALRIMQLAERFSRPIIILIDTPGAFPGIGAEERGQAEAIARNLMVMSQLKTQIICVVLSEGGSGGALGIGIGDRIIMLEHAFYSVISPEGCAAILFRDSSKAAVAAEALKLTAQDLYSFGIIDEIIAEPLGGAHTNLQEIAENIKITMRKHLNELKTIPIEELIEKRYQKYRKIGEYREEKTERRKR